MFQTFEFLFTLCFTFVHSISTIISINPFSPKPKTLFLPQGLPFTCLSKSVISLKYGHIAHFLFKITNPPYFLN